MLFLKPIWVRHEGIFLQKRLVYINNLTFPVCFLDNKPIFSIDIHPKGGRFVTGGQGGQGGRIVIWNIAPVLSETDEDDPKIPKMLCQMDNHLGNVFMKLYHRYTNFMQFYFLVCFHRYLIIYFPNNCFLLDFLL